MNDRITVDPLVCHGKPCIRGLRYPVENVLRIKGVSITLFLTKKVNDAFNQ